jgi:hypothetical protein
MIARESIAAQTVAPKFTGRFNKGVDYCGEIDQFEKEFAENLAVISFAIQWEGSERKLNSSAQQCSSPASGRAASLPVLTSALTAVFCHKRFEGAKSRTLNS